MARYTEKPITLLEIAWIDSKDNDPPWSHLEVTWKGQPVPMLDKVTLAGTPPYRPTVTITLKEGGIHEDAQFKVWREMQKAGVKFANLRTLNEEVVRGVIRVLMFLHERRAAAPQASLPMEDLFAAGERNAPEDAKSDILEFIKDGLSVRLAEDVARGDYARVWGMTNRYLGNFGHPGVDPVPIDPATL